MGKKREVIVTEKGREDKEFKSLKDAAKDLGISQNAVAVALNKKNGIGAFYTVRRKVEECQCSLSVALLGDGCEHCNPKLDKELKEEANNVNKRS